MAIDDLPPLRDVIAKHGLSARKSLGQNFLLDLNLTDKIARAAGELADHTIIEVGPGPGGLTRALLANGASRVIAIERDDRCAPALAEISQRYPGRLEVIAGDARKTRVGALGEAPRKIVANLPYNAATPLLLGWISDVSALKGMTLMFQREVADRIVARSNSKAYGRLSIAVQWRCSARKLFDISPSAFSPPPKVVSSVVSLAPLDAPLFPAPADVLEEVAAAAFSQRRKMLRSSLRRCHPEMEAVIEAAGVSSTVRADALNIEGYCALARALSAQRTR